MSNSMQILKKLGKVGWWEATEGVAKDTVEVDVAAKKVDPEQVSEFREYSGTLGQLLPLCTIFTFLLTFFGKTF